MTDATINGSGTGHHHDATPRWATDHADGSYWTREAVATAARLAPGSYRVNHDNRRNVFLSPHVATRDRLVRLPGTPAERVLAEIETFWGLAPRFAACGLVHKRGVLMHGEPGTGKSAAVAMLAEAVVARQGGVVLWGQGGTGMLGLGLRLIRGVEPTRPVVVVMEDLESYYQGEESELLALLDGEAQVGHVVFVATTNDLAALPPRLRCRPSRFDLVIHVGMPSVDDRRAYLIDRESDLGVEEREEWVRLTEGLSFAHLKEMGILCGGYELSPRDAAERLRSLGVMETASETDDDGLSNPVPTLARAEPMPVFQGASTQEPVEFLAGG